MHMISQKSYIGTPHGGWFSLELKFLVVFLALISFSNLVFSDNTFALYTPTLSASVNNSAISVNGNQVINSADKTTEVSLNLIVNTNNKTGYTAILNSETNETALVNAGSTSGAKIDSIDTNKILTNFSQNTWGYKIGSATNYSPIPALSTPSQILKTTGKTNGDETNNLKLGMKLGETLESGSYKNKLIFSILTNNYERIAIMANGPFFNTKLRLLETATNKIEHLKKSPTPPAITANVKNIENGDSDYEIKLWLDQADKTAYYYTEPEKVYLNKDSSRMFFNMPNILSLDLSSFDTSRVMNMEGMFSHMSNLTSLDLSNFDTSKVTEMGGMFLEMLSISSLNLSNFNTQNVKNMNGMFKNMKRLATLDISNFNTSNVEGMQLMFAVEHLGEVYSMVDDRLSVIYVNNDFDTTKLTKRHSDTMIFRGRKKLRGGNGSYLADPSYADKTWLRVDRPGVQGYFTRKS